MDYNFENYKKEYFKTLYKIESETVSILAKLCEEVKNERS